MQPYPNENIDPHIMQQSIYKPRSAIDIRSGFYPLPKNNSTNTASFDYLMDDCMD